MVPTAKWLVVAKNEYRIHTSKIRTIRPYFPYLAIGLVAVFVSLLAPAIVSQLLDDPTAFIFSHLAIAMVQIILFMIFFYFIIIPITYTLRDVQTSQLEIFLAAPIKPGDVLLGEFLGVAPIYAIVVTVISGLFTAVLTPLGLDLAQIAVIVITIVLTFFSALWIGTVLAALLRTRLGKAAQGKDVGRALAMIIGLPMIGFMYAIMGGGLLEALADPNTSGMVRTVLGVLPSSWGAEIIVGFASSPGDIAAVGTEVMTRFGGLIAFFLAVLWLGVKAANRAYSLETITFIASRAKPDGVFYRTLKYLGGGRSFGTLIVSVFKDYSRRLENLSKIVYMMGVFAMVSIFLSDPDDPEWGLIIAQLILPLLSAFVVGEVTLRGKEALLIYKKTPSGVGRFVKARLLHGWIIVVPIAVAVTTISTILNPQTTFAALLTNAGLTALTVAATVAFVLGLYLLNPAFSDKSGNYVLNLMIVMQGWVGLSLASIIVLRELLSLGLYDTLWYVTVPLSWLAGTVLLCLGKRKLSRIE